MRNTRRSSYSLALAVVGAAWVGATTGCAHAPRKPAAPAVVPELPRELNKVSLPDYVVEPPDTLQLDLLTAVPRPPYRLQPLDAVFIRVPNALTDSPINQIYQIDPDGTVQFGIAYGAAKVAGLTADEAKDAVKAHLTKTFKDPVVDLSVAQTRGGQQVRGPHLVSPDGTVGLGNYGVVRVVGLTVPQVKKAIEDHLSQYFLNPEVAVAVTGYNSKVYYVILDGGGAGQQVARLPATGNETVLDALGNVNGLTVVSDAQRIWISRPAPAGHPAQVLPVDWKGITEGAMTATNYQVLPGDRIFVKAYPATTFDTTLGRVLSPVERLFGITLLSTQAVRSFSGNNNNNGFGGGGF